MTEPVLPCPLCRGRGILDGAVCDSCVGTGRVGPEELTAIVTDELLDEEGEPAS